MHTRITLSVLTSRRFSAVCLHSLILLFWVLGPTYSLAQVKIMPLGDSVTEGDTVHNSYRRPLWFKLQAGNYKVDFVGGLSGNNNGPPPNPDFDLNHQGHGGRNTEWLYTYVTEWAKTEQPDVVLLHAGTNDLNGGRSPESARDGLGRIIDSLRSVLPTVEVLVAQIIPAANDDLNNEITALNSLLPDLAKQKSTTESLVLVVDQNSGFDRKNDLYDNLHPNVSGEEKMATRWYEALESVLDIPLPVSLTQFHAYATPTGVRLQWTTASELRNVAFTVERSLTGTAFGPVGQVAGQGTTTTRHVYSYVDASGPAQSVVYYRLRQIDQDSSFTFSPVVAVSPFRATELQISPVPADDVVVLHGVLSHTWISIWNMGGQLVYRQQARGMDDTIKIGHLASGIYQVQAGDRRTRLIKH